MFMMWKSSRKSHFLIGPKQRPRKCLGIFLPWASNPWWHLKSCQVGSIPIHSRFSLYSSAKRLRHGPERCRSHFRITSAVWSVWPIPATRGHLRSFESTTSANFRTSSVAHWGGLYSHSGTIQAQADRPGCGRQHRPQFRIRLSECRPKHISETRKDISEARSVSRKPKSCRRART